MEEVNLSLHYLLFFTYCFVFVCFLQLASILPHAKVHHLKYSKSAFKKIWKRELKFQFLQKGNSKSTYKKIQFKCLIGIYKPWIIYQKRIFAINFCSLIFLEATHVNSQDDIFSLLFLSPIVQHSAFYLVFDMVFFVIEKYFWVFIQNLHSAFATSNHRFNHFSHIISFSFL